MKPTTWRLPVGGWTATMAGSEQIVPTIGPLSTSLEGCKLFIKAIIDAKPWYKEPAMLPIPWKEESFFAEKKLKVAVLWDDGVVKPHPPVTRALKQVVEKLKDKGNVEIVEWTPYKHDLAWELIVRSLSPSYCPWGLVLRVAGKSIFLRRRCTRTRRMRRIQRASSPVDKTHSDRQPSRPIAQHPFDVGRLRKTRCLPRRVRCFVELHRDIHLTQRRFGRHGRRHPLSRGTWSSAETGYGEMVGIYEPMEFTRLSGVDFPR
jgi:hypothetical protein